MKKSHRLLGGFVILLFAIMAFGFRVADKATDTNSSPATASQAAAGDSVVLADSRTAAASNSTAAVSGKSSADAKNRPSTSGNTTSLSRGLQTTDTTANDKTRSHTTTAAATDKKRINSTAAAATGKKSLNSTAAATTGKTASASSPPVSGAPSLPSPNMPKNIVAGYYTGWSAYSGFTPDKIKASLLNFVHYAFAGIGSDYKIAPQDTYIDYKNFDQLKAVKKSNLNLHVLISVGGWGNSSRFSDMALTASARNTFAKSCADFVKKYGFDGVDIDWEYPVSGGATGRPEDKTNFTLLMKALREALDAQGRSDGKYYYLSFAGGASNGYVGNVQLSQLSKYVDYALNMTYDMHGPWDEYADLNAPLYTPAEASPQYKISADSSVRYWLNAGFPANKLIMGIPFYGYVYDVADSLNNGLYRQFTSAKPAGYDTIVNKYLSNGIYKNFFHTGAQVPYLYGDGKFISYDNPASVAKKAEYAAAKGLKGVSAWELSFDRTAALLTAAYNNLR